MRFRIKNWEHYQAPESRRKRGDRTAASFPWIKSYRKLLLDVAFMRLPPEQRWALHALWLMADEAGTVTAAREDLEFVARCSVDTDLLVATGFLIPVDGAEEAPATPAVATDYAAATPRVAADYARRDETRRDETTEPAPKRPTGWPALAAKAWEDATGGLLHPARLGREFKPLVDRHGEALVLKAFALYAKDQAKRAAPSHRWFAEDFAKWKRAASEPEPSYHKPFPREAPVSAREASALMASLSEAVEGGL